MSRIFRKLAQLLDVDWDNIADGDALIRDGDTITGGTAGGGGGAPTDATYITQTANGSLSAEQPLSALSTGLVKVTNGTGVLSTATGGTDYANASHVHSGDDITSGTVADARIASTIARDSEVTSAISAHESDTTSVHGIPDTSVLETTTGAQTKVDTHVNDTSAAHAASAISASSTTLSGTGTDVQAVLEELDNLLDDHSARHENGGADEISIAGLDGTPTELTNHLNDTSDAHDASAISVADSGTFYTATDVEGVLAEIAPQLGGGGLFDAYAILSEQQAANTQGGTFTSGAWRTRTLNTEVDPSGFVTLSSNQFTLGAGSYYIEAIGPVYSVNAHKLKIYNITDSADAIIGQSAQAQAAGAAGAETAHLKGRITIAGTKTFELQHQCQTTQSTNGLGVPSNFGVVEVYSLVSIWREA